MPTEKRDLLLRQFETASTLFHFHFDDLTFAEVMWRPARIAMHVKPGEDGDWTADWPESEAYEVGPPSAAWIIWHITYWWTMVLDHSFGAGTASRENIAWSGEGFQTQIRELEQGWLGALEGLDDTALDSNRLAVWPMSGRPFADVVGWVNIELTKNSAELGLLRFLYAVRED
ncbi:MAG: DinB family protein [Pseudomonadota bacterium]